MSKKILIVDDEESNPRLLTRWFIPFRGFGES